MNDVRPIKVLFYLVLMYGFDYQLLYNDVIAPVIHIIIRSVDFSFVENLRMFQLVSEPCLTLG